ncbi:MAG: hypothetical protein NTW57_07490 [Methylophilales bacterium]|nr:hypothetical protein [Methylophilales bacterium]
MRYNAESDLWVNAEGISFIKNEFVSTLERGLCSPTVEKVDLLAGALGMHPLTLLSMAYLIKSGVDDSTALMDQVKREIIDLNS